MGKITAHLKMCQKRIKQGIDWDDDCKWLRKRFRYGGEDWEVYVNPSNRTTVSVNGEVIFDGHLRLALMTFGDKK